MAEDRKVNDRHMVIVEKRSKVSLSGIIDVISFDEDSIVAESSMGIIMIKGEQLHVNKLNLDNGELVIEGTIDAFEYSDEGAFGKGKGSLLGRIFK